MDKFSVNNYNSLTDKQKVVFNRTLSHNLSSFVNDIKDDDDLKSLQIDEFVSTSIENANSVAVELYSKITSGVQVGSGNQNFFLGILNAYVEAWSETSNNKYEDISYRC